jgi:hypothetical protein
MMRKIFLICTILFSLFLFSQENSNIFDGEPAPAAKSENVFSTTTAAAARPQKMTALGGNPGDPVPVDNYLPVLILVAAALIYSKGKKMVRS